MASPPSAQQPPPGAARTNSAGGGGTNNNMAGTATSNSAGAFPYPTTLFIHRPNVLHLDLRGVRFDVDINILRLFPESVLVGMFSGAGGGVPGGGAQAYPLLALLQSRNNGEGVSGGLSALLGPHTRPGNPVGSAGILVGPAGGNASTPGSTAATTSTGATSNAAQGSTTPDTARGPVFVPSPVSKTTAMRWQRFYTADEHDDEASDTSDSSVNGSSRRVDRKPTTLRPTPNQSSKQGLAPDATDIRARKPSVEKEKHPTAVLAASSAGEDEERGDSEDGASYDHEEISEDSEDVEDYEPETGIQVLQVNFDPRIFGFILEFFQVMLMSIYSGRAASPALPIDIAEQPFLESSSFGSTTDRGEKPLPSPNTVSKMLEPLMITPATTSPRTAMPRQPQTIVVVREELDYYVMPEGPMGDFLTRRKGRVGTANSDQKVPADLVVSQGMDAIELQPRVPDATDELSAAGAGEYFDDDGNPLDVDETMREQIPQRRLFLLALLRRGCGKWLLDRRRILDASEPTPGSPMLHHLGTVSDVDHNTEWGYREMEIGKCRMVSLAMLRNVELTLAQAPADRRSPVTPQTTQAMPLPASGGAQQAAPSIITQVDEPLPPTPTSLRRPMRKCWWERRFVRCRIPDGMVDAVERRAQRWREDLEKQEKVQAAEAELMAAIARAAPGNAQSSEFPLFNPEDEEQMKLMLKYQEAQAEMMAFRQTAPNTPDGFGSAAADLSSPEDDAFGLDIEVEEDNTWTPVSRIAGEQAEGEQLPGPYNVILNQDIPLRGIGGSGAGGGGGGGGGEAKSDSSPPWFEKSEHIVRLWTRRVYTVEYIVL